MWKLDDIALKDYGVGVSKSTGLLDMPKLDTSPNDWMDLDGVDYWQADEPKLNEREILLQCWISAANYATFKTKVADFYAAIAAPGLRKLQYGANEIAEVFVQKQVEMVRRTAYVGSKQVGMFTLRLTVPGDPSLMPLTVKRWTGAETIEVATVFTNNLKVQKTLQGEINASCTFETNSNIGLKYFDYIEVMSNGTNADILHLPFVPECRKLSTNKYVYNCRFEHQSGWLESSQFLNDRDESDFYYYANMDEIVDLIISNHNRSWFGNFQKGTVEFTERKNHKFSGESCLAVLRRLVAEYELEFEFRYSMAGKYDINVKEVVANTRAVTLEYGKGKGLYELTRETPDKNELATVLFAYGAAKNLKPGYRNGIGRLSFANNPLRNNDGLHTGAGPQEKTIFFDDIFPQRTAHVSSYHQVLEPSLSDYEKELYPTGIYRITDSSLNFDLNDYLLGGLTAKIRMKTGDLAGFEFEILKYDHDWKYIYLIPFKDERGDIYPNATLMPHGAVDGGYDGDQYTLVDIDQPESYVAVAEAELEAAAAAYLANSSLAIPAYRCTVDPAFMQSNPGGFAEGDRITIIDADYAINGLFRISNLQYDAVKRTYELTLSDTARLNKRQQLEMRVNAIERAQEATRKDEPETMKKDVEPTNELRNRILDPIDDKLKVDNIVRNNSIDPRMMELDAGTLQWSIHDALVDVNVDNDYNKAQIRKGEITYHNYDGRTRSEIAKLREHLQPYDPTRSWNIPETTFNLEVPDAHWMYLKIDLDPAATDAEVIVSPEHIEAKKDIHLNILHLKIGGISSSASPRFAYMIWGNVRTFTEAPADGKTYGRKNKAWVEVIGGGDYIWNLLSPQINYLPEPGNVQAVADGTGNVFMVFPVGFFQVSARNGNGETLVTDSPSVTQLDDTTEIIISWDAVPGAVDYRIYVQGDYYETASTAFNVMTMPTGSAPIPTENTATYTTYTNLPVDNADVVDVQGVGINVDIAADENDSTKKIVKLTKQQDDWNETDPESPNYIVNKPDLSSLPGFTIQYGRTENEIMYDQQVSYIVSKKWGPNLQDIHFLGDVRIKWMFYVSSDGGASYDLVDSGYGWIQSLLSGGKWFSGYNEIKGSSHPNLSVEFSKANDRLNFIVHLLATLNQPYSLNIRHDYIGEFNPDPNEE